MLKYIYGEKPALNWIWRSGNFFLNSWEIVKLGLDSDNFSAWELGESWNLTLSSNDNNSHMFQEAIFFQATNITKVHKWKKNVWQRWKKRRVNKLTIKIKMDTVWDLLYEKSIEKLFTLFTRNTIRTIYNIPYTVLTSMSNLSLVFRLWS